MRIPGFFACAAAALGVSCALFTPETEVTVVLPTPPAHWAPAFPDLEFRIVYCDAAGGEHAAVVSCGAAARIRCSRRGNSPVLAYPVSRADVGGLLRPAGALHPLNGNGAELPLTWENGPPAVVMSLLRSLGRDTSLFNAGRLEEYMAREQDPWDLDLAGIARKIADGTFCAYDVDPLLLRDVTAATGAGEWFFESPFSTTVQADKSGSIAIPSIALGMHGLFSTTGRALLLYVGQRETVVTEAR